MKRALPVLFALLFLVSLSGVSSATNGDNLISIGPVSRAMGGVGIASPQDSISAVFSNPAAMCFGPYCPGSGFDFSGTIFMPTAHTRITMPGFDTGTQRSNSDIFIIPAIGISAPISPNLRFGLAAYGVSGLGVDYRDKFDLDPSTPGNQALYTNLQVMKFAPNLAYLVNPNFSIGAAIHVNYGALDLEHGTSSGFGIGAQLGAIYKSGPFQVGATYISPQQIKHKRVANFDAAFGSTTLDDLKLESPQTVGLGVAVEPTPGKLLIETNVKWINWADAAGYKDFGWKNQWVWALGVQYRPDPKIALRAGVNYGNNPIKINALSAATPPVDVQGKLVPPFQYEVLRVAGFPAIVQTHAAVGLGYQLTKSVSLDLGFTHAFKKSVRESGTAAFPDGKGGFAAVPVSIETDLQENSIDFGITWRF
ncbi:MAG: TonB-dependent receptor [Nitrospiraceae bacterium]|nr:TonB-dependent receptor [Nitrospiraceae bacterium]